MSQQPLPPQLGSVAQQPALSNTPPPTSGTPDQLGARRPGRRQYARDAGAYLAGDGLGPPPGAGHGHSQSVAGSFFSPAAPALAPVAGGGGQFFSPGAPDATAGGYGGAPAHPGAPAPLQPGGGAPVGGAPGYGGQAAGGAAQLAGQFGQMGLGGPRQQANVANLNLIQTPLNPLELFTLQPPEINLPPNVRTDVRPLRC